MRATPAHSLCLGHGCTAASFLFQTLANVNYISADTSLTLWYETCNLKQYVGYAIFELTHKN